MNLKKFQSFRLGRLVYFAGGLESGLSEHGKDKEPTAGKEIFAEVAKMKRQLAGKETSEMLADIVEGDREDKNVGTNFLKDDTTILISENSEKSKSDREERHNKAGWKGLVWMDDMVRILGKKITRIDGKEYIKVRVRHNLNKFRNPGNPKYRMYNGYIEVSQFKTPVVEKPAAPKRPAEAKKIGDFKLFKDLPENGPSIPLNPGELGKMIIDMHAEKSGDSYPVERLTQITFQGKKGAIKVRRTGDSDLNTSARYTLNFFIEEMGMRRIRTAVIRVPLNSNWSFVNPDDRDRETGTRLYNEILAVIQGRRYDPNGWEIPSQKIDLNTRSASKMIKKISSLSTAEEAAEMNYNVVYNGSPAVLTATRYVNADKKGYELVLAFTDSRDKKVHVVRVKDSELASQDPDKIAGKLMKKLEEKVG